jgi:hypothetical protein
MEVFETMSRKRFCTDEDGGAVWNRGVQRKAWPETTTKNPEKQESLPPPTTTNKNYQKDLG